MTIKEFEKMYGSEAAAVVREAKEKGFAEAMTEGGYVKAFKIDDEIRYEEYPDCVSIEEFNGNMSPDTEEDIQF
jgi:hypothetical protein